MNRLPTQIWINVFRCENVDDFFVEACHRCVDEAYEELLDWSDGFIWRGHEYVGTLYSCRPVSPFRTATERERGEVDLADTLEEWRRYRRSDAD
jgi:hypothetical protein